MIVFKGAHCTMRCKVLDLSDTGALLAPLHPPLCPNEFELRLDVGPNRDCEVAWRSKETLGVRFVLETPSTAFKNDIPRKHDFEPAARSSLREAFEQSVLATQGDPRRGALLVISVANLSLVKSTYGQEIAKTVFSSVERKLQNVLRGLDVMARIGHSKFGIVLAHCRPEHVPAVAKRFLAAVDSEPVVTRDAVIEVVLSTSILVPEGPATLSDIIAQIDEASVAPLPGNAPDSKTPLRLSA